MLLACALRDLSSAKVDEDRPFITASAIHDGLRTWKLGRRATKTTTDLLFSWIFYATKGETRLAFFTLNHQHPGRWNARTVRHNCTHVAGSVLRLFTLWGAQQQLQLTQNSGYPSRKTAPGRPYWTMLVCRVLPPTVWSLHVCGRLWPRLRCELQRVAVASAHNGDAKLHRLKYVLDRSGRTMIEGSRETPITFPRCLLNHSKTFKPSLAYGNTVNHVP